MSADELQIPVDHAGVQWVSARLDAPPQAGGGAGGEGGRSVLLLAHGAGAPLTSPFLATVAEGLAARGLAVVRFNYAYAERGAREGKRRPPDRKPALLAVHASALEWTRERFPERRLLLAGKSMGGRMGSYLAAEGCEAAGLVFFGYPLHPPGRLDQPRSEHFGAIAQPALFLQGTRDALCDLELLRPALQTFGGKVTLHEIAEADHDFGLPKSAGRPRQEVLAELVETLDRWEAATFPA